MKQINISNQQSSIFTIPATASFVDSLAKGLLANIEDNKEELANQPLGDIDEDELYITGTELDTNIPPAMSPLKRQILLAKTISKLPNFTRGPEQDFILAKALGQLMDQIHTENLDLKDLPKLVDRNEFAEHWQITVDFLSILSEHWPNVLKENGMIDSADRRNRLMYALNKHWIENPPSHPIIAAGSTGSIPATATLLKTISNLPKGSIILPGLDQLIPDNIWQQIDEGHPQATLKNLLGTLEISRQDIQTWPHLNDHSINTTAREQLISEAMLPAEATDRWQTKKYTDTEQAAIEDSLGNVKRYDCKTPQEEALLISVLLRETLETKSKIGALVTPDRKLARRVTAACRRWNIEIDDSAGQALTESDVGIFLQLCAQAAKDNLSPVSLLAFLKHRLNSANNFENFRKAVQDLEKSVLRGLKPKPGFKGLINHITIKNDSSNNHAAVNDETIDFIYHLENLFSDFIKDMSDGHHSFSKLLDSHIKVCDSFKLIVL